VISPSSDIRFGLVDVRQRRLEGNIAVKRGKPRLMFHTINGNSSRGLDISRTKNREKINCGKYG
jgi:hypothetical protein